MAIAVSKKKTESETRLIGIANNIMSPSFHSNRADTGNLLGWQFVMAIAAGAQKELRDPTCRYFERYHVPPR